MKLLGLVFVLITLSACAFDPVTNEKKRRQEHEDHLKQNGY